MDTNDILPLETFNKVFWESVLSGPVLGDTGLSPGSRELALVLNVSFPFHLWAQCPSRECVGHAG